MLYVNTHKYNKLLKFKGKMAIKGLVQRIALNEINCLTKVFYSFLVSLLVLDLFHADLTKGMYRMSCKLNWHSD